MLPGGTGPTPFWSMMIDPSLPKCVEGECHDAGRDCTDPAHAPYRAAVARVRRARMFYRAIQSLPPVKRRLVVGGLRGPAHELLTYVRTTLMRGGII